MVRQDIQFLRGFAVLAVLFYHTDFFPVAGGYLGVDTFFVISGYLITSIILKDLDNGTFSFTGFYIRRAKRLLPAVYCTLIFTTIFGYAFLTDEQWNDYVGQLIGTVTFSANIVLPFQTGYFESAAEGKPLLHMWSLSIEEQYYLIAPFLLYLIAPKWRGWMFFIVTLISLAICMVFVSFPFTYWRIPSIGSESMAFFLLPTRAWELLAGSILAWLVRREFLLEIPQFLKLAALFLLLKVTILPFDSVHPRVDAIIVVIATAVMLAGGREWLPLNKLTKAISKIGDCSYSLYLVHWPLLAFAYNAYLGSIPTHTKVFLFLLALFLAYMQYQFVEQRFRYAWKENQKRTFQWLTAASILVVVTPVPAILAANTSINEVYAPNRGLNIVCSQGKVFSEPSSCMTSDKPMFALWGDSYAMHLVPGIKDNKQIGGSLIQITKAACGPILGVASIDKNYDAAWAETCLEFNEKSLRLIRDTESIKYVIMSSPFSGYFDERVLSLFYKGKQIRGDRAIAITQMVETINKLISYGKQPIIVAPPPRSGFDIGECWKRKLSGLIVLGRSDCNFQMDEYYSYQEGIINGLKEIENRTNIHVLWFNDIICDGEVCSTIFDGKSLYKDEGHLSIPGAVWAVPQLNLLESMIGDG